MSAARSSLKSNVNVGVASLALSSSTASLETGVIVEARNCR